MRKLLLVAIALTLAWIFVVPSCSDFGCESARSAARADSHSCPSSLEQAAQDTEWARSRLRGITDAPVTTGLFYDEDGNEHTYRSGEDDDSDLAEDVLDDRGAPRSRAGTHPAAAHVEVKVAALMRNNDVSHGVLVINNVRGPCGGTELLSCQEVLPLVLKAGTVLVVWSPPSVERGRADTFTGVPE